MRRILVSALLVVPSAACVDGLGDRAETGECPPGERCSPETPRGLRFDGARFGDAGLFDGIFTADGLEPTAIGGIQTIALVDHDTDEPLDLPFTARIDLGGLEVVEIDGPRVVVAGFEPRLGQLEIRDEDGLLYDQIRLGTGTLASVALAPAGGVVPDDTPWLAYAGGRGEVVVALRDELGARLVDESLTFTELSGTPSIRTGWDTFAVLPGEGGLSVRVEAGDAAAPFFAVVPATAEVDEVAATHTSDSPAVGGLYFFCLEAADDGVAVAFVPWTISIDGPATPLGEPVGDCQLLELEEPGSVTITATEPGGLSATLAVEIRAADERAAPPPVRRARGAALGERAASAP